MRAQTLTLLGCAALGLGLAIALASGRCQTSGASDDVSHSLLAFGDTGHPARVFRILSDGQLAVSAGIRAEHRRNPVDGVVLLGDNFYQDGLQNFELVERIRTNVVEPYCGLVELRGPRSAEVREACDRPSAEDVWILALLGNHDVVAEESPYLQRHVVPHFVSNWHMPPGEVEVRELGGGLSVVVLSAQPP